MSGTPQRRLGRPFRAGAIVGVALVLIAYLGLRLLAPELWPLRYNVEVVVRGAEVSRSGGAKVLVRDARGLVAEQACREDCDDLQVQIDSGDNEFRVSVLDTAGRPVAEGPPLYVTSGTLVARFTVAGEDRPTVRTSFLDRTPRGGFDERPAVVPTTAAPSQAAHAP